MESKFFLASKQVQGFILMFLPILLAKFGIVPPENLADIVSNVSLAAGSIWFAIGGGSKNRKPLTLSTGGD